MKTRTKTQYAVRHYRDVVFDDLFRTEKQARKQLTEYLQDAKCRGVQPWTFYRLFRIRTTETRLKLK